MADHAAAGRSRLLLVGAGHAHLHLLQHADRLAGAGYAVTVVAPRRFDYSGVASAVATGGRGADEGSVDVAALAARGGVTHRDATVAAVDPAAREVSLDDGERLGWDRLCLNLGSVTALPTGVRPGPRVLPVKPLHRLHDLRRHLADPPAGRGHRVTVLGGGPSGVELAGRLAARDDVARVRLLEHGPRLLPGLPRRAGRRVADLLAGRGVDVRTGAGVDALDDEHTVLADGSRLAHDLALVATGLVPPPLVRDAPLGGPRGVPVRGTLRHRDHDDVHAVGDCADFLPRPLPRVGVHGVRQAPVLLDALLAGADGRPAPVYRPQRQALAVLDLGGGTALAVRGRWWWLGPAALAVKHRIDDRWLAGYR